jgi:4-amino-4-deoxy-L-arabinose transferase-like glycosyltransferase
MQISRLQGTFLALLAGLILFIPFLGGVHLFDWDEINFAEAAREMIRTGDYLNVQINYATFWEKPPLFIWMQVLSMKIFGISEFAARFPNAICGIVTLMVLFRVGERIMNKSFAALWMLVYAGSILPFFYFKSGIIDPWFNLFIFLGVVYFSWYFLLEKYRIRNLAISAFFIGLAILTKGPVALLIIILVFVVYMVLKRFKIKSSFKHVLLYIIIVTFTGGFWFILQLLHGNLNIIIDFIEYQIRLFSTKDSGHGGFLFYHFVVLFFGVFPASVFALFVMFRKEKDQLLNKDFKIWMSILFWVVLILFTIVKTKIVHYSSLCYFPLTYMGTLAAYQLIEKKIKWRSSLNALILSIAFIYGGLIIALSYIGKNSHDLINSGIPMDDFTRANLAANVYWSGFEMFLGIFFFFSILIFIFFVRNPRLKISGIFLSSLVFVYLTMIIIAPRIEAYSQRAAIEFYKSIASEDTYVATLGFKSYAHFYYSDLKPYNNKNKVDTPWLLNGQIDKDAYFVFKLNRKERYLNEYPQLKYLYEKNGFVFTKREKND